MRAVRLLTLGWLFHLKMLARSSFNGLLSILYAAEIAAGRGFAGGFALFVGLYWLARLAVQYAAFNTPDWPDVPLAKHGLGAVVLAISLAYLLAFWRGLR